MPEPKKASRVGLPGSAKQGGNHWQIKADVCYVSSSGAVSWLMGLKLFLVINYCPSWWSREEGHLCVHLCPACRQTGEGRGRFFCLSFLSCFQLKILLTQSDIFWGGIYASTLQEQFCLEDSMSLLLGILILGS